MSGVYFLIAQKTMAFFTNKHEDLIKLAESRRVLLVFLRHFGCTFCRETMTKLANERTRIESQGVKIVLVHMVSSELADRLLRIYELPEVSHISDPGLKLYHAFGLQRATFTEFYGFKNWYRAFVAGLLKGHFVGKPIGDTFQMPGAFLFYKSKILNKFKYKHVSDMPNFLKLTRTL